MIVGKDKILHFSISGVISFSLYGILFSLCPKTNLFLGGCLATGLALLPGILKEFLDSEFSWGDLVADVVGVVTGSFIFYLL